MYCIDVERAWNELTYRPWPSHGRRKSGYKTRFILQHFIIISILTHSRSDCVLLFRCAAFGSSGLRFVDLFRSSFRSSHPLAPTFCIIRIKCRKDNFCFYWAHVTYSISENIPDYYISKPMTNLIDFCSCLLFIRSDVVACLTHLKRSHDDQRRQLVTYLHIEIIVKSQRDVSFILQPIRQRRTFTSTGNSRLRHLRTKSDENKTNVGYWTGCVCVTKEFIMANDCYATSLISIWSNAHSKKLKAN